jgi:hypothetical protein
MGLFSSRFAKLESFVETEAGKRTPAQLTEAQAELDRSNAGLMLVPTTEKFKTGADLDKHLEALESRATDAEKARNKAVKELADFKAEDPNKDKPDTPPSTQTPPPAGEETPAQKEQRELDAAVAAQNHNKTADRIHSAD